MPSRRHIVPGIHSILVLVLVARVRVSRSESCSGRRHPDDRMRRVGSGIEGQSRSERRSKVRREDLATARKNRSARAGKFLGRGGSAHPVKSAIATPSIALRKMGDVKKRKVERSHGSSGVRSDASPPQAQLRPASLCARDSDHNQGTSLQRFVIHARLSSSPPPMPISASSAATCLLRSEATTRSLTAEAKSSHATYPRLSSVSGPSTVAANKGCGRKESGKRTLSSRSAFHSPAGS